MSSDGLDHNHYALDHRHRTSGYDPAPHLVNSPHDNNHRATESELIPPLPAYAYNQPNLSASKRPSISTSFEQYASNASINGFTSGPPNIENSPDPHDFYRPYQDRFSRDSGDGFGPADIAVVGREDNMTAARHSQRSTPVSVRTNGFASSPLSSRPNKRSSPRSSPSPIADRSYLGGAKSSPHLSSTARNRQTSLKDLVNKFNQTPDEIPPVPMKSGSRTTSATTSPATSHGPRMFRSRTPSESKVVGSEANQRESVTGREESVKAPQSRYTNNNSNSNFVNRDSQNRHGVPPVGSNSYASQSMINLGPTKHEIPRKPLFGEVLAVDTGRLNPGFGIHGSRRRRGSEGSMHSPNPMFPDERNFKPQNLSPSSPTAWYMGVAPSLDGINLDKPVPARPPGLHRRSRSDFSGNIARPPVSSSLAMHVTIMSPPQEAPSPLPSPPASNRNSKSRIPISTRRLSTTSDSGNSSSSIRAYSALGRARGPGIPAPIVTNPLSDNRVKPPSPTRKSQSSPRNSPRSRAISPTRQHPVGSASLKAYISAPVNKISPPLRSSRPRQPVSTASTSASRARAVERLAGNGSLSSTRGRDNRTKNLPELGGVDFAARRQRIQQAFTKTVKENERRDEIEAERRRMSVVQIHDTEPDNHDQDTQGVGSQLQDNTLERHDTRNLEKVHEYEDEAFASPAEQPDHLERELTINTTHLDERSVLDLTQEDSPTLGINERFMSAAKGDQGSPTPPSDGEPMSAVTTNTTDTFFDNEPQEDLSILNGDQSSLLSRVLSIREAQSPNPASIRTNNIMEDILSDRDDQESIQIMLGHTPVNERLIESNDPTQNEPKDGLRAGRQDSRWSTSSWTSSVRSKDRSSLDRDRELPTDRIDEHSTPRRDDVAHSSLSTAASNHAQQLWSPGSGSSPLTGRSTLDSDHYSTINRVLDDYHDSDSIQPESMHDFQRRILSQSPHLARAGGWDLKKVTQLYLQDLARTKYGNASAVPDPLNLPNKANRDPQRHVLSAPDENQDQSAQQTKTSLQRSIQRPVDDSREQDVSESTGLKVSQREIGHQQRASLNHPDDWANTSPSMLDWIHHQAEDTPTEDKALPRMTGWVTDVLDTPDQEEFGYTRDARASTDDLLKLPEIQRTEGGLGIDINVESPQDDGSPTLTSHLQNLPPRPSATGLHNRAEKRTPPNASALNHRFSGNQTYPASGANSAGRSMVGDADPSQITNVGSHISGTTLHSHGRQSLDGLATSSEAGTKAASPSPDQKRLIRRRHIIKELVDTEHSFGQDMKVVDDIYKGTSNVIIISTEDVKTLFGNSDQVVAFSTSFLDALKQAAKSVYVLPKSRRWRSKRESVATSASGNTDDQSSMTGVELSDEEKDRKTFIGEAFGQHMAQMEKIYADYLKNHDAANQKLQALQNNEKVKIWLKECRAYAHDLTTAWDLDSLLVKPVQRILKYPLLLKELLEVTPENHPDFTALDIAAREMVGVSVRINEMKKRADLMEQVALAGRKRKDYEGRIGFPKAFGRRTEKFKQQVGLSDNVEDREYNCVAEKFGLHFFQLQVVMRDVEMYTNDVQAFVNQFNGFVLAIESYIDVGQTSYPEVESKWRKFRMSMREILMTALTDHVLAIRKNVIEPMTTLLKLHDGPQKLMHKRAKRVMDFARFKAIKDRGEKPDRKTTEQGEQFIAVNDTLKEELPKLFALTGKLVEACLNNFVQLQRQWQMVWRRKLSQAIDNHNLPSQVSEIVNSFSGDFKYTEAQVLVLGVCNGAMLADIANPVNFLSPTTTLDGEEATSPRRPSTTSNPKSRTMSYGSDASPVIPPPNERHSGSFSYPRVEGSHLTSSYQPSGRRMRASSAASGHSPATPEIPGAFRSFLNNPSPVAPGPAIANRTTDESPSLPRLSVDTPGFNRLSADSPGLARPQNRPSSPNRYSGFFSSAMPMSDSPRPQSPVEGHGHFNVLFLAASVYEFNIDRARKEAGYPYLTYVAGEIFDVIGEKGELWLAKNQDDATNQVGWIWNKHFAKLAS